MLALAAGFTFLPLSFTSLSAAHAEPLAPTTYTITGTHSVGEGALFRHQPNLRYARVAHTATLLPDGKVLIAGGGTTAVTNTTELYDPTTESFTPTNNLLSGRSYHTATLLPNGKVLIAGGVQSPAYAELYDPATGTFTPTGNKMHPRYQHTATLLEDGRVLIVGGRAAAANVRENMAETEIYDPASNTFTLTTPITVARYEHTATLLSDGTVLVAGGFNNDFDSEQRAELYDPATESWTPTANMQHEHSDHTATLLEDGKVLIAGNYVYADNSSGVLAELYDGATGQFTSLGSMDSARGSHTATRLPNGYVVFVGPGRRIAFYIPGTNEFRYVYLLREVRRDHTATLLQNGHLLIAGGRGGSTFNSTLATAALGSYLPANTFTGSLTLPPNWIASRTVQMSLSGTSSAAPIDAYALTDIADINQVTWTPATSGEVISVTHIFPRDGYFLLNLYFRDVNVQRSLSIQTPVYVDSMPPVTTTMSALPATSPTAITLNWNGVDHYSGVATHDVEVRVGTAGEWTPVVTGTSARSITYQAPERGRTYYFRARATDNVGHVQPWPSSPNT
ncbi:MAG TPA: kelch repeat-containing protein, partial [Ardenticatenaceae bacterium]